MKRFQPTIFPLGRGAVMTALGDGERTGDYWIVACPDGYHESDGKPVQEAWDQWLKNKGPHVLLHFPSVESVERIERDLAEIKSQLASVELR